MVSESSKPKRKIREDVRHHVDYVTDWWVIVGGLLLIFVIYAAVSFMVVLLFMVWIMIVQGIVFDVFLLFCSMLIANVVGALFTVVIIKALDDKKPLRDRDFMKRKVSHIIRKGRVRDG